MRVWITKYATTKGICEVEANATSFGGMLKYTIGGGSFTRYLHKEGRDYELTREAAIISADRMRAKKIASLEKQIAKLRRMKFD